MEAAGAAHAQDAHEAHPPEAHRSSRVEPQLLGIDRNAATRYSKQDNTHEEAAGAAHEATIRQPSCPSHRSQCS